jgi:hypothetical protein
VAALAAVPGTAGAQRAALARTNLLTPVPIPAVRTAAAQARAGAPIPSPLNPASSPPVSSYVDPGCVPSFGAGTTYALCSLGAVRSRHLVVLLGDSHAWMWIPGFVSAARSLNFRLVPLTKPGCALWALDLNRPGWPCLTWYAGVLRRLRSLRPSATVVSFLTANFDTSQATFAAHALQRVLRAVPHPVLLADPPSDDWYTITVPTPEQCMGSTGANLGSCALYETPAIHASLAAIQAMANRDSYPAIPTLQWFCAGGVCPTVVDGTVTSADGNHITPEYARLLAPRLANQLLPILARLWRGADRSPARSASRASIRGTAGEASKRARVAP